MSNIINDINSTIKLIEQLLDITITEKNKLKEMKTLEIQKQSKVIKDNIIPLVQSKKGKIECTNIVPINDGSKYLQQFKSLTEEKNIDIKQFKTIINSCLNDKSLKEIPFELYYYLYVINFLSLYKNNRPNITTFDNLYIKLAKIKNNFFPNVKTKISQSSNSSLSNRYKILTLIEEKITKKIPIKFDKKLIIDLIKEVNLNDIESLKFNIQTIKLYLFSIEFYKEYSDNQEILDSIEELVFDNNTLIDIYYYYSFLSVSRYNNTIYTPSLTNSNDTLLYMYLYDWLYNDNYIFSLKNDSIKTLTNNNDINHKFCLSVCNQRKEEQIVMNPYISSDTITIKGGILLASIQKGIQYNENDISTIKQYNNFELILETIKITFINLCSLNNSPYYFFQKISTNEQEINQLISDDNVQLIFVFPQKYNNKGSIYQRMKDDRWWDYSKNKEYPKVRIISSIKKYIQTYSNKINIYVLYKVFLIQLFFEQNKSIIKNIEPNLYSVMIELLYRYQIQCIKYIEEIKKYFEKCFYLPNAKKYIVEQLKELIKIQPNYKESLSRFIKNNDKSNNI